MKIRVTARGEVKKLQVKDDFSGKLTEVVFVEDNHIDTSVEMFKIDISEISDYFETDARRYSRNISLD